VSTKPTTSTPKPEVNDSITSTTSTTPPANDPLTNSKNILSNGNISKELLDWSSTIVHNYYKKKEITPFNSKMKIILTKQTRDLYKDVKVKDFSTSWSNGLALCAICHHFIPDLIDLSQLKSTDVKMNLRQAFKSMDSVNLPRVLEYSDFSKGDGPDQLAIITCLFQLRSHFEGAKAKIKKSKELSPSVSRISSSSHKSTITNTLKDKLHLSSKSKVPSIYTNSSIDITTKKEEEATTPKAKDEIIKIKKSSSSSSSSNTTEELVQRAKELNEKTNKNRATSDDTKKMAEKLLASRRRSISVGTSSKLTPPIKSPTVIKEKKLTSSGSHEDLRASNQKKEEEVFSYKNELEHVRKEQIDLDEQGKELEKVIRQYQAEEVSSGETNRAYNQALKGWYLLLNKRNTLLHRERELELILEEKELERRHDELTFKLRQLMAIDEFDKTNENKKKEAELLNDLVNVVNERNELVRLQHDEEMQ
jgi:hypothetical protein